MASNFPTSLDAFTNPTSADALDSVSVPHASQHSDLNDAVEALEAKVGADGSAVTSSHDYKIAQLEAGVTGGKILQVVSTTHSTGFSTTSGSWVGVTGLSVSITPSSATSKVLVILSAHVYNSTNNAAYVTIFRDSVATGTNLGHSVEGFGVHRDASATSSHQGFVSASILDSPATTSATTYEMAVQTNTGTVEVMRGGAHNTITAIEVAA